MHETEQRRRLCGAAGSGLPRLRPAAGAGLCRIAATPATAELPPK